jgi:hypothetical protein
MFGYQYNYGKFPALFKRVKKTKITVSKTIDQVNINVSPEVVIPQPTISKQSTMIDNIPAKKLEPKLVDAKRVPSPIRAVKSPARINRNRTQLSKTIQATEGRTSFASKHATVQHSTDSITSSGLGIQKKMQPVRNLRNSTSHAERPKKLKPKPLHEQFIGKFLDPESFKFKSLKGTLGVRSQNESMLVSNHRARSTLLVDSGGSAVMSTLEASAERDSNKVQFKDIENLKEVTI